MKIYIGSDHKGFEDKQRLIKHLSNQGYEVVDVGPYKYIPTDDYTEYAIRVSRWIQKNKKDRGILICGSGVGMYIVANKFKGIRAAESRSIEEALHDREHHDSNILVLGSITIGSENFLEITKAWLNSEFKGGRHARRMKKLDMLEEGLTKLYKRPAIVPVFLSENLDDYTVRIEKYKKFTRIINFDINDGIFVSSKTPGVDDILRKFIDNDILLTIHLMVDNPSEALQQLTKYTNVVTVYVHIEKITNDILAKEYPFTIGLVISDYTDVEKYKELYSHFSIIQVMTVGVGKVGSTFLPEQLKKIDLVRSYGFMGEIHIDGGVNKDTILQVLEYRPDVLNVNSGINRNDDYFENFNVLVSYIDNEKQ